MYISPTQLSSSPHEDCRLCWILMVSLCLLSALTSSLLASFCVYSLCRTNASTETAGVPQNMMTTTGSDIMEKNEHDLCYASLDIRQDQRKPRKQRKVQNADFSTYSVINTSKM
ncbi:hypothetical protein DPEC_G00181320 [Dallia pectoralis]|uniref:Uncharacterized protein n=1 Tax=Dallia pectoralis TaxID=75939 RepID=A0ACC2GAH3_DALPE|nr:hypothetical protein DPEC_G00181320 [Dallia pectoralis]